MGPRDFAVVVMAPLARNLSDYLRIESQLSIASLCSPISRARFAGTLEISCTAWG